MEDKEEEERKFYINIGHRRTDNRDGPNKGGVGTTGLA
jgi:hypothetical protein